MFYKPITKKGFTLFEILLVIAIGFIVMLFSLRIYEQIYKYKEGKILETNAETIMSALSRYYYTHCRTGLSQDVNLMPQLIDEGFLDPTQLFSPAVQADTDQYEARIVSLETVFADRTGRYICTSKRVSDLPLQDPDQKLNYTNCPNVVWTTQVHPKGLVVGLKLNSTLQNEDDANAYRILSNGDCQSDDINWCSTPKGFISRGMNATPVIRTRPPTHILWSRLPSEYKSSVDLDLSARRTKFDDYYTSMPLNYQLTPRVSGGGTGAAIIDGSTNSSPFNKTDQGAGGLSDTDNGIPFNHDECAI